MESGPLTWLHARIWSDKSGSRYCTNWTCQKSQFRSTSAVPAAARSVLLAVASTIVRPRVSCTPMLWNCGVMLNFIHLCRMRISGGGKGRGRRGHPSRVALCRGGICQNFVKVSPILIIFDRKMSKRLLLCQVHPFSTTPKSRHHTTVRRCSKLLHNALIISI